MSAEPADAAYQGTRGAFSEEAARTLLGGGAKLLACATFAAAFEAVNDRRARFAVLPIENTLAGSIHTNYDLLASGTLEIVGEAVLRISHALIAAPGAQMEDVRRVLSHPVALAQCEGFFRRNPHITAVPVYDTAGAAEQVVDDGVPGAAAIASANAAEVYGGVILERELEDHTQNFTRFLLLGPAGDKQTAPRNAGVGGGGSSHKTSLMVRLANRPGALHSCLGAFASRQVDLVKIESRPLHGAPFEYLFYLDVAGRIEDAVVADGVAAVAPYALSLRVLGSYPCAPAPRE